MRTPEKILENLHSLETELLDTITQLNALEDAEMVVEPEHRKMVSELMNSDFIAKLPNQSMRDDALENYILNNEQYRPMHEKWLIAKNETKRMYRKYRFLEECLKDCRTELQLLAFGGDK